MLHFDSALRSRPLGATDTLGSSVARQRRSRHLTGFVFSAVTKAVSSAVTRLTDIKKFLRHVQTHTHKHTQENMAADPYVPNTQGEIEGLAMK